MRRFTSSLYYGVQNWPVEFKDKLSPLISSQQYQEGSLNASSLEQALKLEGTGHIKALPPVREVAWEAHMKPELRDSISVMIGRHDFTLLTLYDKATALSIGGFILGSTCSRFKTKAHVMALHPKFPNQSSHLARIEHFAKVDLKLSDGSMSIWTACVSFYYEHNCRVWFGGPTQVWAKSTSPDLYYIQLSSIGSRVAYCETCVDFGSRIGKQTVIVASIISEYGS